MVYSHRLRHLHIELPRPQKPQHGQRIQPLLIPLLLQRHPQLMHSRILLLGSVPGVSTLRRGSRGREVVVVVFGVQLDVWVGHCCGVVAKRLVGVGLFWVVKGKWR